MRTAVTLIGLTDRHAGAAESYASEAIELALDAVDDAEAAVLDALRARLTANALVHAISSAPPPGQVSY